MLEKCLNISRKIFGNRTLILVIGILPNRPALAKKTNQTVYEEPFDIAGGGSSLTRSTQEGVLFSNPALLPYGGNFHRWLGYKFNLLAGSESLKFVRNSVVGNKSTETNAIADQAFKTPIHFGTSFAFSWLTNNFGMATFYRLEPDLRARKVGENGIPELRAQNEAYAGGIGGFGARLSNWLSLGVAGKYIYKSESDNSVSISDQEAIKNASKGTGVGQLVSYGHGVGYDAGMLLFLKSDYLDLRVAGKIDDVGGTKFTGTQDPFLQTLSAGVAITFHNNVDALHLSADIRDIKKAYGESIYKRSYMGVKLVLREHIGFATGLYQGYPAYGAVIDLFLFRVAASYYGREYGTHESIGVEARHNYIFSFAMGF